MLKYIKNHITSIDGIEIYPLISLCIFFIFFILLFFYVFRGGKKRFEDVSQYPIADKQEETKSMNKALSE
jgi:cbb3-type cytochrome oxidase subunit 3